MHRKLFIIFILFLVPLQVSWASVVSYCQHESGVAANHTGHHDVSADHGVDSAATDSAISTHSDCGACHIGCLVAQVGKTHHFAEGAVESPAFTYDLRFSSPPAHRLERPQWPHLA